MLGASLPVAQSLFPSLPLGQAVQPFSDVIDIPPAGMFYVPSGYWMVGPRLYSFIQWLNPVTNFWMQYGSHTNISPMLVNSDGSNVRIVNASGLPIGALVTAVGSGYLSATTVVTSNTGGSLWRAVVGGAISATVTIGAVGGVTGGTNFTIPPVLVASVPPNGGVQAGAVCTISGGAINSVTVIDQGAGYSSAPTWQVIPNPLDPNIGIITVPPLTSTLTGAGTITAVLPTYQGTVLTTPPTLTIAGSGSAATATAIMCFTITAVTITGAGVTVPGTNVGIDAIGGTVTTAAGATVNPAIGTGLLVPRKPNIFAPVSGGAVGTPVIVDGGLFQVAPTPIIYSAAATTNSGTAPTATFTMGGSNDRIWLQNLGPLY